MKRFAALFVLAAVGVALLIGQSMAQQKPAPVVAPAAPTKVCVCDIVNVFNNYQKAADKKNEFQNKAEDLKNEANKRQDAIKDLDKELQGLKEGSADYEKRLNEMKRLSIDLLSWKQYEDDKLKRMHFKLTGQMYQELLNATRQVAKARGFDVVLAIEPREIRSENEQELMMQIAQRKVLWANSDIDITSDVLQAANEQYRQSQNGVGK